VKIDKIKWGLIFLLLGAITLGVYFWIDTSIITVKSAIKEYNLQLNDKKSLENYMDEMGVYSGVSYVENNLEQKSEEITKIKIFLTNKKYNGLSFVGLNGDVGVSYQIKTKENGILEMYIGVGDYELVNDLSTATDLFNNEVILAIYQITHPSEFAKLENLSRETLPLQILKIMEKTEQSNLISIIRN